MNIQLLKRLYSIYSPSGKEQKMVKFLVFLYKTAFRRHIRVKG